VVGYGTTAANVSSLGAHDLVLSTNEGTTSGTITITDGANGDITLTPNGTGAVIIDGNEFPQTQGTVGQILVADGAGLLEWANQEKLTAKVKNADSVTINKGEPVYVFSAQGDLISVKRALNTGDSTSAQTLGLAAASIAANAEGLVVCQGVLTNVDTSTYTAGQALYLGATAGSKTTTKPYAPNHLVYLGFVEKINASSGRIYVRVQNGYELDEIHDVDIDHTQALASADYLTYNGTTGLWQNAPLAIEDDVAPILGGDLNVGGNSIVSVSNGNIELAPNGTGIVVSDKSVQLQATSELRFADTDSSNYVGFKAPGTVSTNRIWTLPATDGTAGQLLSTNGSGVLSWATDASGGGGSASGIAIVSGTLTFQEFTGLRSAGISETTMPHTWTESSDPSGLVTVSTNTITITSAGTYLLEYTSNWNPYWYGMGAAANCKTPEPTFKIYNSSDSTTLATTKLGNMLVPIGNGVNGEWKEAPITMRVVVTIASSKSFTIRYAIPQAGSTWTDLKFVYTNEGNLPSMKIIKLA
jgi:hypothetical protein